MTDIQIDPSVLKERTNSYSSLTDTNDANVFTDNYEERMNQLQTVEREKYQIEQDEIFIKELDEIIDVYEQEKIVLFSENQSQILEKEQMIIENNNSFIIPIMGTIIIIMIIGIVQYNDKRNRKRRKKNVDIYSYESHISVE